jgi:4-amino-4-deoxy-L-arabinose transferase-like glycosyltransferase
MIIIGYGMARVCYGPVEGVMVTIILSLLPLDIVFSSQVMPDLPQSVLGSAAILCFLVGQKKENKFYFIISGILLSLSIMTKEFACIYAIILLFFVGHAIITGVHTPTKALAALAITIGSSMVVLFLFWLPYLVEKIPWAPFKVVMNNATAEKNDNPDRWFYFKLMFNLYQHPWSTRYFGIFYYFVGIALVYLAIGDFPKSSVIGLWLLFYLSFIQ